MDISLNYIEAGSGTPMLLLHGNNENNTSMKAQIDFFSKKYRVFAPDTRGHGKSPRGSGEFTLSRFADDLNGFMDEHKLSDAIILGFSDGANIAMLFAVKYPRRVRALILCGGNLRPDGVKGIYQLPTAALYALVSMVSAIDIRYRRPAEMLRLMVREPKITYDELSAISAPVLVVAGTRDMIKRAHTEAIARAIAGSRLVFLEGDHFLPTASAAAFNSAVGRFLREKLG